MAIRHLGKLATAAVVLTLPGFASAFTIYDTFGSFPDATWGGDGIPNDAVAASKQIVDGDTTITIAMSATERYSNLPVSDNGAAIYQAGTGQNCGVSTDPVNCPQVGTPLADAAQGALWNWNYYVSVENPNDATVALTDYQIDIYYDFDPAGPNAFGDLSGLGRIDLTAALNCTDVLCTGDVTETLDFSDAKLWEGSENLLFGFLAADFFDPDNSTQIIDAPGGSFDPNATGNYQFAMTVTRSGFPVDTIALEVNVVPVPAAVWLFGSALGLLGWVRRRKA
jgi:hypothetical protein